MVTDLEKLISSRISELILTPLQISHFEAYDKLKAVKIFYNDSFLSTANNIALVTFHIREWGENIGQKYKFFKIKNLYFPCFLENRCNENSSSFFFS